MLGFLLLTLCTAWAQEDPRAVGRVGLQLSEGATVQLFPRVKPDVVELIITGQDGSVSEFFRGRSTAWTSDMAAYSIGNGSWLARLYLSADDLDVDLLQEGSEWTIQIEKGTATVLDLPPALGAAELFAGELKRSAAPRPPTPLHPLDGDALTITMNPREYRMFIPEWQPSLPVRQPDRTLLVWPETVTMSTIDGYREVLTSTPLVRSKLIALYRLGTGYLELGIYHESLHYMDRLAELAALHPEEVERMRKEVVRGKSPWNRFTVSLYRAQAALALGRFDVARERCREAMDRGAPESHVLECLGVVSLGTSDPPPSETGRALASTTGRPQALLLAAQLLQLDHRHKEAEALLRTASQHLEGPLRQQALINLGDARFAHGDLEGAREAWRWVGAEGDLADVLNLRGKMVGMVEKGPRAWTESVPVLHQYAHRRTAAGAEAGYLLAQIAESLGDTEGAAEHLNNLMNRQRAAVLESDVPERLWRVVERRLSHLNRQRRILDQATFYRDHYRAELRPFVTNTYQLEQVTEAFESLGLYDMALYTQVEVFAIQTKQLKDTPKSLLKLVRLYVWTKRYGEALETISYARTVDDMADMEGEISLLEGIALENLGRRESARTAFQRAMETPATRVEGLARLALLDALEGRCDEALPGLDELARVNQGDVPDDILDGRVHIALARCLLSNQQDEAALAAAAEGAGRADDILHKRYATYLAAVAAERTGQGGGMYYDALQADDDLWADIAREFREDDALSEELKKRMPR